MMIRLFRCRRSTASGRGGNRRREILSRFSRRLAYGAEARAARAGAFADCRFHEYIAAARLSLMCHIFISRDAVRPCLLSLFSLFYQGLSLFASGERASASLAISAAGLPADK